MRLLLFLDCNQQKKNTLTFLLKKHNIYAQNLTTKTLDGHFFTALTQPESTGPSSRRPSQQPQQPVGIVSIERSWWPVSQLYRQVGFVEKLKTIAGPCESLCGEAYVADLHVKNTGASHTHYTRL